MLEASALVVKIDTQVWVISTESNGCANCIQKNTCSSNALSNMLKRKPIPVKTDLRLKVGDTIIVSVEESLLLKATLWLYSFPLILLLFGAGIGESVYGLQGSIFGAVISLIMALFLLHKMALFDTNARPTVIQKCTTPVT